MLKASGLESPALNARTLLCHLLERNLSYIYSHGEDLLDPAAEERYFRWLVLRASGVPLQHITGTQEFMSLNFHVTGDVLIPRQDTEILVEHVLNGFKAQQGELRILDMCTGSGCIAVSLAYYLENCRVSAVDVSEDALAVARKNAEINGVADRVDFTCSDLFEKVEGFFDAIVSNPPYIPDGDIEGLSPEVRDFEPRMALDGGRDGLDFYRKIIREAPRFLKQGGLLAFEVGIGQAEAVGGLMKGNFKNIRFVSDLSNIVRVIAAFYNDAPNSHISPAPR